MFFKKNQKNQRLTGACIQLLIVNFHDVIINKGTTVEKCVHIC